MKYLISILFVICAIGTYAHGDLDARIKKITKQIEKDPSNPDLYIKRGELYFQHEEYKNSIVDYEHANALGVSSIALDILFAQSYDKAGKYPIALDYLENVLKQEPDQVVSNRLKGNILVDQQHYLAGAKSLEHALQYSIKKLPEHYVGLATAYRAVESDESNQKAIQTMLAGVKELGDLPVFLNHLVSLYQEKGDYENAIKTQSKIIAISKRKEIPYLSRAKLYRLSNNISAAKDDLIFARKSINSLPRRLLNSDQMIKLVEEINMIESEINE